MIKQSPKFREHRGKHVNVYLLYLEFLVLSREKLREDVCPGET